MRMACRCLAERRVNEAPGEHDAHREDRNDEEVERDVVFEREVKRPYRELGSVDVEQTVLTTGERVPLHRHEPEHLAARDRHQGKVDASTVRDEAARPAPRRPLPPRPRREDRPVGCARSRGKRGRTRRLRCREKRRARTKATRCSRARGCSRGRRSSRSRPRYRDTDRGRSTRTRTDSSARKPP